MNASEQKNKLKIIEFSFLSGVNVRSTEEFGNNEFYFFAVRAMLFL
jgi:hypothetical protein